MCLVSCLLAGPAPAGPLTGARLQARLRLEPQAAEPLHLMTVWRDTPASPPSGCVGVCLGPVCSCRLTAAEVQSLLRRPDLTLAELPTRYRPRLDRAGPLVSLPQARQRFGTDGTGVLIAVIDTGLDWRHPDFRDADGRLRVAWLLDQNLPASGVHPELESIGGGAVYSSDQLQAALEGSGPAIEAGTDRFGHGTHVAGIAAGADPIFTGAAPGARLVAVAAMDRDGQFSEDRVLAGLAFAHAAAVREGQPLVINLSLGTQLGAHDGSEPLELALDALVQQNDPPCAVVVAAGNEAGQAIHARAAVRADGLRLRFPVAIPSADPPGGARPARVAIDFWFTADGPIEAWVEGPSGERSDSVGTAVSAIGLDERTADGRVRLSALAEPHPVNGLLRTLVELEGEAGAPLREGVWTVVFAGQSARVDGWVGETDLAAGPSPHFLDHLDPGELVGPPATARLALAVGGFQSRTDWTDVEGAPHVLGGAVGQPSPFSVAGPTRDGRPKPELLAPAQSIAAALSSDADPLMPGSMFYAGGSLRLVMPGYRHALASGTSMAAPLAAGLAALLFEHQPGLNGEQVQALLSVAARADADSGFALFEPGWGFGKLDAAAALALPGAAPDRTVDPAQTSCGAARSWMPPTSESWVLLTAVPRDAAGLPLGPGRSVQIEGPPGVEFDGPVVDSGEGIYSRALCGSGLHRGSRVALHCRVDGETALAQPTVQLAASAEEAAGGGAVGGACASAGGLGPPGELLLLLLLWLRHRGRRSRVRGNEGTGPRIGAGPVPAVVVSATRREKTGHGRKKEIRHLPQRRLRPLW